MSTQRTTISTSTTLNDIEAMARNALPKDLFDLLGATETESTLCRNIDGFSKILLRQRVFQGSLNPETSLDLFGAKIDTPVLVAPVGLFAPISNTAELEVLSGALKAKSMVFVAYGYENSLENLAKHSHPPLVYQGFFRAGYEDVRDRIKKAESLGFSAVGVTVDTVQPIKIREHTLRKTGPNESVTIKEVEKLRKETSLPFFVKGIMCEEDALMARDAGADAIIVSNHGGRILDYSRSTIEALPGIVKAVGGRKATTVLVDGGIRRGTDVLKALALGAKAVLIGRPVFWSVAVGGSDGVATVITKLTEELKRSMVICGVPSLDKIDERILIRDEVITSKPEQKANNETF